MEKIEDRDFDGIREKVPPSGGSLEIGKFFGCFCGCHFITPVPPSGGSLEIGKLAANYQLITHRPVPPSGGSLEIGKLNQVPHQPLSGIGVPPSGGSLEIGNQVAFWIPASFWFEFPLRGDP